jgi:hypothetical protein
VKVKWRSQYKSDINILATIIALIIGDNINLFISEHPNIIFLGGYYG